MRWKPSWKPHPGKGKGLDDMVSILKCLLSPVSLEQAKEAVKLEPKGKWSGYGSHNYPYGDVEPPV